MASSTATTITKLENLALYRSLRRISREFKDYNIRKYTRRRTIDAFRTNCGLTDPSSISAAFAEGKSQHEIAKLQVVIYSLFAPKMKSVMDQQL